MSRGVSKQLLQESEECFAIFSQNGILQNDQLGIALRSLGFNPTNAEIEKILQKYKGTKGLNWESFKVVLKEDLPEGSSPEEIREAFAIFDGDGNGTISASELRHVLMTLGEKLSEEEVNVIIRDAEVNADGYLHYEQFVHLMTRK